jgi:excinuclease ABC subunit C
MLDRKGRMIYVGKAKSLRARLLSYFRESSDPKAGKIIAATRTLLWEPAHDEFAALLRELELIQRFRPRMNVLGQPDRERLVYLCLGREPAQLYFSRTPNGQDLATYGPFRGIGSLAEAARQVNLQFGLRDCPNTTRFHFADQPRLFDGELSARCLRHELGTCLAPCAGFCTRSRYRSAVKKAKLFLDGTDTSLLSELEQAMRQAAAAFRYEQAQALKSKWDLLTGLQRRLHFLRDAREQSSFVYPLAHAEGPRRWYLIKQGEVQGVVPEPVDAESAARALSSIQDCYAHHLPLLQRRHQLDSILIVTAWFRKYPEQQSVLLSAEQALARCADLSRSPPRISR